MPPESSTGDDFHFVLSQTPNDTKDRLSRRLAKSHAVKKALEKKRLKSKNDFRVSTVKDVQGRGLANSQRLDFDPCIKLLNGPSPGTLDPFKSVPVDSVRLQILLHNCKANKAPEPVFSVMEELNFQSFHSVFRVSGVDDALLNAVMLSLSFAAAEGSINQDYLNYRGLVIRSLRQKMDSVDASMSESTIGTILLLAGVEAQLGTRAQVQLHMDAVERLLALCRSQSAYLTGGIKRAIFWQDLHASILTGSRRVVDHTTFAELQWTRDPFTPNFYELPRGFGSCSHLFSAELIEVLKDVHALQCIRDAPTTSSKDMATMAHINNHIASIQSRLVDLREESIVGQCCRLAAYIASVMLCCTVWCSLVVPTHLSSTLLHNLQDHADEPDLVANQDLLIWIIFVGGSFAPPGPLSDGFRCLLQTQMRNSSFSQRSWPELVERFRSLLWSQRAFEMQMKVFWEGASSLPFATSDA